MRGKRARGRPSGETGAPSDAELLDAALDAFAEQGFAGTSVREVARRLGVSHNLIPQRFGSKERLWYAAVDHGFGLLLADLLSVVEQPAPDDTAKLQAMIVRFVEATAARPALVRIIHQEATSGGERLEYLYRRYIAPVQQFGTTVLETLHARGEVRTRSVGLVYFLMTHGAGGPPAFPALARRLGVAVERDDPAAARRHAREVVEILFEGLRAERN